LLLGFAGLLIMAVSGVAGHGGDHSGHGHGHGGGHLHAGGHHGDLNVHGAGDGLAHAHGPDSGDAHHGEHGADRAIGAWFLSFLSPRVLFSILIGIGAAGLLLGGFLGGPLLAAAAVAGGFAFELLAVRPVWNFFFRFG